MGDYAGSYDHTGDEEAKSVVNEELEDWSWMQNARTEDAGALNAAEEGEDYYEEEEYYYEDGINYELEYSYTCDSSQQVAIEGAITSGYGHRRVRSASAGCKDVLVEDESRSSKSSEEDEYAAVKVKPKTKKKGARGQFSHLQELDLLDAHSDPGYGGSYETDQPELGRNQSINLVTSWLRDATLGKHLKDSETTPQHAHSPPKRRPPPRRHPPGADMAAHDASRRSHSFPASPNDHMDKCVYEPQYYDNTAACDPHGYQCSADGYYEDHQLANYDQLAAESIYRPETKPLDKAFKFVRNGAVGFANVSKTAAVGFGNVSKTAAIGFGNVSKTAAVGLKSKTIEFKNLAVPVLTPILNAVIEESKEQLMGPDQGRGPSTPIWGRGRGRGRGFRGRAQMARPMQPGMRPAMRPPGIGPGMRPVMRPGMVPAAQRPLMRPGMAPPPDGQPLARRPGMMPPPQAGAPVPAARGQGVAMRGQPRPMGAGRGRARPVPAAAPTDF